MSQQAYKNALRIFSLVVVIVGVYQTYRFQTQELLAHASQNNTTNSGQSNGTTTAPHVNSSSHYDSGVSIFATAQAQTFVKQSLSRRGLTPIIKTYTLTGIEWVFNAALMYGHFVVALYVYSAFKNPENSQGKKIKIVGIGLVVLFAWIYFANKIGYEKIKVVDRNGEELYHTERAEDKPKFQVFLNENDNHKLFFTTDSNKQGSGTTVGKEATQGVSSIPLSNEIDNEKGEERDEDYVKLPSVDTGL